MFDARQVANWFVRRAKRDGKTFSIMEILKLIYIAHGWHLEVFKTPLFGNRIEAWKFGPVVPDVYDKFRGQGIHIQSTTDIEEMSMTQRQEKLLEEVYNIYAGMDAFKLSEITHTKGGPWDVASDGGRIYFAPISNDLIQGHYENLRSKVAN